MNIIQNSDICPVELAGGLDNKIRRFLQNPTKLLGKYLKSGDNIIDFGCGPGFFTIEMAKALNGKGIVWAVDLQEGMLSKINTKIQNSNLQNIVKLHQCKNNTISLNVKADFILAFYVIHEIPDKERLFSEFSVNLKPNGKLLIVEPKGHVNKKAFSEMENKLSASGFTIIERPSIFFSRAILLTHK